MIQFKYLNMINVSLIGVCLFVFFLLAGCGNVGNPFGTQTGSSYEIEHINPADNATGISINTLITIAFPVDMDETTLQPGNLVLQKSGSSPESITIVYDQSTRIVTIRPLSPLSENSAYQIAIHSLRSLSNIAFTAQVFNFHTGSAVTGGEPQVIAVTPLPGQEEMVGSTVITVSFSLPMNQSSVEQAFSISNGVSGTFSWSIDSKVMTFTPGTTLPSGTTFAMTLLDNCVGDNGVPLKTGISWYFKTKAEARFIITDSVPVNGATTVSPDVNIRYTLSSPVDKTTVTTNFLISPLMATDSSRFTYEQSDQIVIYTPPAFISAGTVVNTTWATGLMSTQGQSLSEEYTLLFTIENIPPDIVSTDPSNGSTGVEANRDITFVFNEPVNTSTVNLLSFTVEQPAGTPVAGVISFANNNRNVIFTPSVAFSGSGGPVVVTATTAIEDLGGTAISSDIIVTFSIDNTLPVLISSVPANGATDVVPDTLPTLIMNFSKPLNEAALEGSFSIIPSGGGGTFFWSTSSEAMQYTTSVPLIGATLYTVAYTMIDLAGNSASDSFSFTIDNDRPVAYPPVMSGNGGIVNLDSDITIVFNERMRRDTVESSFSYTNGTFTWGIGDGTATWNPDETYSTTMTFNPNANFFVSTGYTVIVTSGALDVGGLPLTPSLNATFTTTNTP